MTCIKNKCWFDPPSCPLHLLILRNKNRSQLNRKLVLLTFNSAQNVSLMHLQRWTISKMLPGENPRTLRFKVTERIRGGRGERKQVEREGSGRGGEWSGKGWEGMNWRDHALPRNCLIFTFTTDFVPLFSYELIIILRYFIQTLGLLSLSLIDILHPSALSLTFSIS